MLETGDGGGGTPWESMTLDKMHELIQNPSTDAHWRLVSAWQKSAELLNEHRFQVQQYRENLAAAWPPAKSAASAAYLERLDQLINNLTETYEASIKNRTIFSTVTGSIYQAQVQMNRIYQEYQANKALSVTPERQEALRLQAVKLLGGVSNDLAEGQLHISTPPAYQPGRVSEDDPQPIGTTSHVPPPLPPVTRAVRAAKATADNPASAASASPVAVSNGSQQPGLILGGAGPLPSTTPPTAVASPLTPALPTGVGSLTGPGTLPPVAGFLPRGVGPSVPPSTRTGVSRGTGLPPDGVLRSGASSSEGVRATTPGGIIGGVPARGSGQTRRPNPIGRVAGSRRVNGSTSERPSALYGQAVTGRQPGTRDDGRNKPWDPDNPWETEEGVTPVLLPAPEQRIDPGPVIGLP